MLLDVPKSWNPDPDEIPMARYVTGSVLRVQIGPVPAYYYVNIRPLKASLETGSRSNQ